MVQFQIVKVALGQIIDRLDLLHGRHRRQRLFVVQFIELGRCQRRRQEGEHENGIAVEIGLVVDVFVRVDGAAGKETKLVHQRPLFRILNEHGRCRVALRGIIRLQQNQRVAVEGFHVNGTHHAHGGGQQEVVATRGVQAVSRVWRYSIIQNES